MTPASVDGGPATMKPCPFCEKPPSLLYASRDGSFRYVICTHCGATCGHGPEEAAIAAWNTRPTTRDAALREEGRVQGLRDGLGRALLVLAVRREVMRENGILSDRDVETFGKLANELANEFANDLTQQPTPDASQGSAPVTDSNRRDK